MEFEIHFYFSLSLVSWRLHPSAHTTFRKHFPLLLRFGFCRRCESVCLCCFESVRRCLRCWSLFAVPLLSVFLLPVHAARLIWFPLSVSDVPWVVIFWETNSDASIILNGNYNSRLSRNNKLLQNQSQQFLTDCNTNHWLSINANCAILLIHHLMTLTFSLTLNILILILLLFFHVCIN